MKYFIKEIKKEWSPIRYYRPFQYSKSRAKYFIKRLVLLLNKEISGVAVHLLSNPLSFFILASSLIVALMLVNFMNTESLIELLGSIAGFIISFISVLVAAAIFISTLHRQSSNKTADEDIKFHEVITDNKGTLARVYELCNAVATSQEKIKLFKATPCDMVSEYSDYERYKEWHLKNISTLNNIDIETHEQYLKYPYNTAMSVAWNRSYFIADGCEVAIVLLERAKNKNKDLKVAVKNLLVASKRNQTAGSRAYYVPTEFVGQRLYRVVIYSIFALLVIFFYTVFKEYPWNLLPTIDIHLPFILLTIAVTLTIASLYLILRYVFKFIAYLRDSTSQYSNGYNSFYIYEPDEKMHDPSNTYGI